MITVELSRASQGLRQALWQLDAAAERAALAPPALLDTKETQRGDNRSQPAGLNQRPRI